MMINESVITQLEKRARGFRRIISALNDLPMYGINPAIDKMLYVRIGELKDHLKKKLYNKLELHIFLDIKNIIRRLGR